MQHFAADSCIAVCDRSMVICKDRVYVLSVPDAIASPHGKLATHESTFVHDLVVRLIHNTNVSGCDAGRDRLTLLNNAARVRLQSPIALAWPSKIAFAATG